MPVYIGYVGFFFIEASDSRSILLTVSHHQEGFAIQWQTTLARETY